MREFFIIGHNPNKVADALNDLQAGANALEPDIHSVKGEYFMGEGTTSTDLSLIDYLQSLSQTLETTPALTPALVMFDTKNSTGDIASLFDIIQENFSDQFSDTSIMVTRSQATEDEYVFFTPGAGILSPDRALGVDEHTEPEYVDSFFKSLAATNYTYADGISILTPLLSDFFKERIKKAVAMRDNGNSFKIVYSWTLDSPADIDAFLSLNPDGLITDSPSALKQIITTKYAAQYQLAQVGYQPFK